jgi:hypothetical protein
VAVFRPSARVRLQLRIDEMADTGTLEGKLAHPAPVGATAGRTLPATKAGARAALESNFQRRVTLNQNRASLAVDALARERSELDRERQSLQAITTEGQAQAVPDAIDESRGTQDDLNVIFSVLPRSCSIERNPLKDADTARLTFDFRDVPVDPRIVRACFVAISMGTVSADDYAAGMEGQTRDDGSLRSLVAHESGEEMRLESATRFTGFADRWEVTYGEDGDTIELNCRDVSSVLRDQPLYNGTGKAQTVDYGKPIEEAVQELVDGFVATRGIRVILGTPTNPDNPLEVLAPPSKEPPIHLLPKTSKKRKGKQSKAAPKEPNQKLWDHILDCTLRLGLVPVMRSFTLYLLEPRVMFADLESARKMIWGRNVKELRFARKLGGMKCETIEVRSFDASIGRTRWARYPVLKGEPSSGILGKKGSPQPVTTRASHVSANGTADERVRVLSVPNVADLKTLELVAEQTFNEMGRQEIEGTVETHEIDSFESEQEGDLLRLLPGEALQILVASPVETGNTLAAELAPKPVRGTSNLQELHDQSVARRVVYLESLGIARATAERLAEAQEKVRLISSFRVQSVQLDWSAEDGIEMGIHFSNFVVVREAPKDVTPTKGPKKSLSATAQGVGVPQTAFMQNPDRF